ncbi:hypothetical protein AB0L40_17845 [Patulibacter sp. NPDC049589]|uniref:hypothetical protein n=1 Tax=Patulibacter sp. NPDC049589 TaxID=3154731 RepID=UPI00341842DC
MRTLAVALAVSGGIALTTAPSASAAKKCTKDRPTKVIVCINQHGSTRPGYYATASFRNLNKGSLRIRPTLTDRDAWSYKGAGGFTLPPHGMRTIKVYHEGDTQVCSGFYLPTNAADGWTVSLFGHICGWFTEGNYG